MTLETARSFFLWCSIINYAMLMIGAALCIFWQDGLYRTWGRWFRLSPDQFDMLVFGSLTLYKTGIILFNVVPCIVLYFIK